MSTHYENLKSYHGEAVIDYLKIDGDWDQWEVIPQIIQSGMLSKIRQLSIELHLNRTATIQEHQKHAKIVKSLEEKGMVRFNSKPNAFSLAMIYSMGLSDFTVYEITWFNSRYYH